MKGATTEPCVKTIRPPNIIRNKKIGNNQYFFLANKKTIKSFKNSNIINKAFLNFECHLFYLSNMYLKNYHI